MSEAEDSSTGPESTGGLSAGDARAARGELALQLRGGLPCVRCGYNLGGLSIRGVCPECGTPIRATLLVVVDPHAKELQPVPRAGLVVAGLLAWAVGALAAALLGWSISLMPFVGSLAAWEGSGRWARVAATGCLVISGIGAIALVRPHARIPWAQRAAAAAGAGGLLGLAAMSWWIWGRYSGLGSAPSIAGAAPRVEATLAFLAQAALVVLVIVCLRPNARLLEARSLLLRSGRVDRQTMYAMAAAAVVVMAGHVVHLVGALHREGELEVVRTSGTFIVVAGSALAVMGMAAAVRRRFRGKPAVRRAVYVMGAAVGLVAAGVAARHADALTQGRGLEVILTVGTIMVAVGWMLVTIGLVGVLVDVMRLCPVLLEPSPSLGALLAGGMRAAGDRR